MRRPTTTTHPRSHKSGSCLTFSESVLIAIIWRILTASVTRTFFQPDEYFQSLEVAHHAVFGYGRLTWEWSATPPIRSILFPTLYMPVFWLLKMLNWDHGAALIVAPKVLQGFIAAVTDVGTRELARKVLGARYADTAFFLALFSFFHLLALGRTLSNSVETSLTTAALCLWPWHTKATDTQLQTALALAAGSCMIRPTSAITWIFLCIEFWWHARLDPRLKKMFMRAALRTSIAAASVLLLIDSFYYGRWTLPPLNFVLINLSNVSIFYGESPWHYYLTQGLPIIMNVMLPVFFLASYSIARSGIRHQKLMLWLIIWTITIYSLLGHKEWRFIHPILPMMHVLCAKYLVDNGWQLKKRIWSLIFLAGVVPGMYVALFHGRGQIQVMFYLRSLNSDTLRSVGFLMPCHSTPWQGYLHRSGLTEGRLWALGCEPPLRGEELSTYQAQDDIFYDSPLGYLASRFPATVNAAFPPSPFPSTAAGEANPHDGNWKHEWPSHLVLFGALLEEDGVRSRLTTLGYSEQWASGVSFEQDRRRRGGVHVWAYEGQTDGNKGHSSIAFISSS